MRKGTIVTTIAALLGLALPGAAQTPPAGRALRFADIKESARNLLLMRVEEVDWTETTFEEIMDWLRRLGEDEVNVIPSYSKLQPEGVERDSLVTLKLRNVMVADVLTEVLEQLSDDDVLRIRAYENTIKITTRRDVERKLVTVVYRIEDLLFRIPDMGRSAPTVDLDAASRQGGQGGGGGGGGQSIFGGAGGGSSSEDLEEEEQEIEARADELITTIKQHIEPTSWTDNGGPGAIARFGEKTLVVTNTIDVHEKLAGFFEVRQ